MDQMIVGILIGVVSLGCVACGGWLIYALHDIAKKVNAAVAALNRAAQVFEKSADVSGALVALTAINRQLVPAVQGMTVALKAFTGVVLQQPEPEEPPQYPPMDYDLPRRPMGRPPVPPMYGYATVDEAGVLSQEDEDLAGIEFQREAEARGEPTVEDILGAQTQQDIRAEV